MDSAEIKFHKDIAADANNAAWSLIEMPDLGEAELCQLIALAGTARQHWHLVGTEGQIAHADLLFAWALARAKVPAALHLAEKAWSVLETGQIWEQAFAQAALAAASLAAGDETAYEHSYAAAAKLGSRIDGPTANYFTKAFRTIPKPKA